MAKQKQFVSYIVNRVGIQTLLVLAIIVVAGLAIDEYVVRWDLTEDQRFSISPASHKIAGGVEDPLTIRAYFSNNIPERIQPLQRQVFDVLAEYEAHGGGKIEVERLDPQESQAAASEAENYGIRPINLQVYEATQASAIQVYGGIVLLYRDKASEAINIAERYPQGYEGLSVLEYEISSKIWQLTNDKPRIGLCGYLANRPPMRPFPGSPPQGPQPHFSGMRQLLGEAFTLEELDLDQEEPDPAKLPLLLVVRPKEFSDVATFRLDQYLIKGGRVLMFITQGEVTQRANFVYNPFKTGLDEWLAHHGLRVPNEFVCHAMHARQIGIEVPIEGLGKVTQPVPNWFWPQFAGEGLLDPDNPAVQTLNEISLFWPHPVDVLDHKLDGKTATVLVQSDERQSWRWKDLARIDMRALQPRLDGPTRSQLRASPVAVALEGSFKSFFAGKPVPPSLTKGEDEEEESSDGTKDEEDEPTAPPEVVAESLQPTQLVVIGNSFFISDLLLGGQGPADQKRQAGLLAFNLVDWLARSSDLIALRAKRYTSRRLDDRDFEDDMKALEDKAEEMTVLEFKKEFDQLREQQKRRWKRARWMNILLPTIAIVVAGAVVWILRAAMRARGGGPPVAVAPASTQAEE